MKYAFIGSGNMARAIIGGLVGTGKVARLYGTVSAAPERIGEAGCVVVAVKPQSFPAAAGTYAAHIAPGALVVSIMAGIGTAAVEAAFPQARVTRVMPNLALAVGCGAAGVAPGKTATEEDVELTVRIFSAAGVAVRVEESEIDSVAALSGSGAAYIYFLVENLRDAAVEDGMEPEKAALLARQTLIGAARQLEAGEDVPPEELRRRITSKKGTTEAAVNALAELGLPQAVRAAYQANKRRSRELAEGK